MSEKDYLQLTISDSEKDLRGKDLIEKVVDPDIRSFEVWFQSPKRGNGPLTRLERDLLRSYLYWKITRPLE